MITDTTQFHKVIASAPLGLRVVLDSFDWLGRIKEVIDKNNIIGNIARVLKQEAAAVVFGSLDPVAFHEILEIELGQNVEFQEKVWADFIELLFEPLYKEIFVLKEDIGKEINQIDKDLKEFSDDKLAVGSGVLVPKKPTMAIPLKNVAKIDIEQEYNAKNNLRTDDPYRENI